MLLQSNLQPFKLKSLNIFYFIFFNCYIHFKDLINNKKEAAWKIFLINKIEKKHDLAYYDNELSFY